jgi:hypothetical protein
VAVDVFPPDEGLPPDRGFVPAATTSSEPYLATLMTCLPDARTLARGGERPDRWVVGRSGPALARPAHRRPVATLVSRSLEGT